ncbi:MAG TPA: phage integrase N-terminal SAM-like domain-containing protein, partial [Pseudonocardia sp.]
MNRSQPSASTLDLASLLESWQVHLRAERKSPNTISIYSTAVRQFLAWAKRNDRPAVLDRATVNAFVANLLERGAEPMTALNRQFSLRRFSAWLREEDEI